MKTKNCVITVLAAAAMLLPVAASAQLEFTGARMFAVGADGKRAGSCWNTVGGDATWNVYFFTGTPLSPKFLNSGNTEDSMNPKFNLVPGTYTFGFACDSAAGPDYILELSFNDDPQTGISVLAHDGG